MSLVLMLIVDFVLEESIVKLLSLTLLLVFLHNEGVAAGVEAPYIRVNIVAAQCVGTIFHSTRDGNLATTNARASSIDAAMAVTQGHAPYCHLVMYLSSPWYL